MSHVFDMVWYAVYATGVAVGLVFIAGDWLQRRARRRAELDVLHPANDNRRERRKVGR